MPHPNSSRDFVNQVTGAVVTGLFIDRNSAERAYRAVIERGYDNSDISLVMSDETRRRNFPDESANVGPNVGLSAKAAEETAPKVKDELGGPVGGTVGTLAPVVVAAGTLMLVPGLIVAGPVAIGLAAAGAVAVTGGLIGALTNWGIPKGRVEEYEAGIRGGGILLGVKPRSEGDAAYFEQQWRASGGRIVHD